jgi:hypothetical protein
MTVNQLINLLNDVEDKTKEIYIFKDWDISDVCGIDEMDDRVDINIYQDFGLGGKPQC